MPLSEFNTGVLVGVGASAAALLVGLDLLARKAKAKAAADQADLSTTSNNHSGNV